MPRIDFILIVSCECLAFLCWAINYKKIKEKKYKLFAFYLGIIALLELLNLLFAKGATSWSNFLVMQINVPLQFIFFLYFLLCYPQQKIRYVSILFCLFFITIYILEKVKFFVPPTNFNSVAYGTGTLLLIISIVISLARLFKSKSMVYYNQDTLFWILMGLVLFYVGSFPYQTFRNYLWASTKYTNIAYGLHYLSQTFNCCMYLLFAYSVKWKIK